MKERYLVLFSCGALVWAGCGRKEEQAAANSVPLPASIAQAADGVVVIPADSPKLKQIRVEAVRKAEIPTDEVIAPGKIEANPNRVSHIVLPVAGRIGAVMVKIGDAVLKGQPLLTIESPEADSGQSAYLQSQAALNQAQAALIKAQADFDRSSDLFEHNAVAKKEVLSAEAALAQAKSSVLQAQAAREQTQRRLGLLGLKPGDFGQQITVRAPIPGKVLEMSVASGEYRNDTNASLMTIADLSTVWVSSDVPETSIRLIKPGERVDVTLAAYPGQVFRGRVTRIADTVDPQTRTVKVRAEMINSRGQFRPEMFGNIRHTESMHLVPVLPVGGIIQGDGRTVVFVETNSGHFRETAVTTGKRSGDVVPVLSGVTAGDRVVVDGAMLLKSQ